MKEFLLVVEGGIVKRGWVEILGEGGGGGGGGREGVIMLIHDRLKLIVY